MHTPVLLNEILEIFNPQPGEIYIDATVNGGGHAQAIAKKIGDEGKVIGIDWDQEIIDELQIKNQELGIKNIELACGNYIEARKIAEKFGITKVNGILFDLGFSAHHIEKSGRGFSFQRDEPLDMRYNPIQNALTAATIVNTWPAKELERIFREYGEERYARQIACAIVQNRTQKKITRTEELVRILLRGVPPRTTRIHPATRVFQALRIAVNSELENIKTALDDAVSLLLPGGYLAVISFHSLEDRIVKDFFREKKEILRTLTKKPIRASEKANAWAARLKEIKENPRARSARLRAAEKIG